MLLRGKWCPVREPLFPKPNPGLAPATRRCRDRLSEYVREDWAGCLGKRVSAGNYISGLSVWYGSFLNNHTLLRGFFSARDVGTDNTLPGQSEPRVFLGKVSKVN